MSLCFFVIVSHGLMVIYQASTCVVGFRKSLINETIYTHLGLDLKAYCWGVTRKIWMIPLTREREFLTRSNTKLEHGETVIPPADCTSSKNLNSFTRALAPPFIGR
jgi:hypothetical protein